MECLKWIGAHIELILRLIITIFLIIPFIKTWKACEEEIKSTKNILETQSQIFLGNLKKAQEYCNKFCNIDLSGITNIEILESRIKTYNLSVKEYRDIFLNEIKEQDEKISNNQNILFELRKNEWKSIFPFLSAIALMWLGIKF